jgi:predicted MFS family arabinose efflux permease
LLYGASLLWISASASTAELYLSFGAAAFFGAGASAVAYARAIVHRFDRLRGLALGITMSGGGLAGMLLPLIVQPVVLNHGWRSGMVALAVLASCIHLIGGWLARDSAAHRSSARAHDSGYAVREAATTQAFWLLTATFVVFGAVIAAVTAHLSAIWRGLGLDLADVLTFQFVMGAAALLGRVLGGAMMDWIPAKYVGAGAAIAGAIGLLMLGFVHDNDATLMIAAAAIGFCTGAESDVVSFLSAQLFGRRNFGRIYGVFASAFLAGAAIGPFLFAVSTSTFGYARLLGSCALALGFSALTLSLLVAPQQAVTAHKTP